jgi:hypothetical protein
MRQGATQQAHTAESSGGGAMRAAFLAFTVLAIVVWIGIAIGANTRTPGVVGLAATVFGGLFSAVLVIAIGGTIALKLGAGAPAPLPAAAATGTPFPELAPALAELEALQHPVAHRTIERAAWRAPLGAAAGIALWSVIVAMGAPGGVIDFAAVILGGALAGYGWALAQAARENADIYSQRAVDVLVGGLGAFNWRNAASVDLASVSRAGLLPVSSGTRTSGEVAGAHAGLAVRITPLETIPPSGADKTSAFKGLLVDITAPHLGAASMDELAAAMPAAPALIAQLSTLPQLGAARSAIVDGRLFLAIPETGAPRVFDPPSQPGAPLAAPRLARIRQVLGAVVHVADALAAPTQA